MKKKTKEKFEKKNELWEFDRSYGGLVLGVDEAGRGPLAGPVVAGAVMIPEYFAELDEINDSKKLTEKKREKLYNIIMGKCVVGIGMASEREIDDINILNATFLAMRRAINEVDEKIKESRCEDYGVVLVDGNHKIREYVGEQECVVKGDAKSLSIAAASIIAKVTRDRILMELSKKYPDYDFERHKGYGTKIHREKLLELGPCPCHRKSFLQKILGEGSKVKEEDLKLF